MPPKNWWAYQTITEARQRNLAKFDEVTRAAQTAIGRGDYAGAKKALTANNPKTQRVVQDQQENFRKALRAKWEDPRVGADFGRKGHGGSVGGAAKSLLGKAGNALGKVDDALNSPASARVADAVTLGLRRPEEERVSFGEANKQALKDFGGNAATLASGERFQDELGINTEYMDRLRAKGFGGRLASAAIDTATAPLTYVPGIGIGGKIAKGPLSKMGQTLAARWAGEVGAGVGAQLASEEASKFAASKTDNPFVVGATGVAAGLVGGAAGYGVGHTAVAHGPGAVAAAGRGAQRLENSATSRLAENFPSLASGEAGEIVIKRPGDRLVHGTDSPVEFDQIEPKGGAMGKAGYFDDKPDVPLADHFATRRATTSRPGGRVPGDVFDDINANPEKGFEIAGSRQYPMTPKGEMQFLREDMPITRAELGRIRKALPPEKVPEFNEQLKRATALATDKRPLGSDARFALDMVTDYDAETTLKKAGFGGMYGDNISKWNTSEVAVFDPENDLQSWFDYSASLRGQKPFDEAAALRDAEQYFSQARQQNGKPVALPPGVKTPQDMVTLRRKIFEQAVAGQEGRFWYERSAKAILDMFEGDTAKAEQFAQLIALYSPKKPISPNFNDALRAYGQWMAGDPITVGSRQQWKTAEKVLAGEAWTGRKTNSFYRNMMGYIDPQKAADEGLVTVDRHIGTAFGYKTTTDGSVMLTDAQYRFAEKEVQALAENLGWTPEQTQAAIWVTEKALKDKTTAAVSKFDFADSLERTWAQVSWETAPGQTTGFAPWYWSKAATEMDRMEYHQAMSKALLDDQGHDIIADAYGLASPGSFDAPGVYVNTKGVLETNPGAQTRIAAPTALQSSTVSRLGEDMKPILDAKGKPKTTSVKIAENLNRVDGATRDRINAYAATRGALLRQEAVPWTKPFYVKEATKANGLAVDIGRMMTVDEAKTLASTLGPDIGIVASPEGAWFLNFSELDNVSFQNKVAATIGDVVPEHADAKWFASDGEYVSNDWSVHPNGEGYDQWARAAGASDVHESVRALLEPRVRAIEADFADRFRGAPGLSDAAGSAGTSLAVDLGAGAAGAGYGYATGDDPQDRWKRALAFGLGGAAFAAGVQAAPGLLNPRAIPSPAPPRPTSVLATLPEAAVDAKYVNASGIERIVPKTGTGAVADAVAIKRAALKSPSARFRALPPVVQNGTALLNPSVTMDQDVLVGWRAALGTRAQLKTAWNTILEPKVAAVEDALAKGGVTYNGPTGTAADPLIGTIKDIAENPELYTIPPELRTALDDLNVSMWDDVSAQARANYGVEVRPFEGDRKPGFVYLATMAAADSPEDRIDRAFASLSTNASAKRRGFTTARDNMMKHPDFVPETDLRTLVGTHVEAMASNASHSVLREGAGGRYLGDVLDELHPGLREEKVKARSVITNLNARLKTATAAKKDILDRLQMNDREFAQVERRMKPIEARVAALESESAFGPELSYLSGQLRELRMMQGKLNTYAGDLSQRGAWRIKQQAALGDAIDTAQGAFDRVLRNYQSAGTGDYAFDPNTYRWYTKQGAETMQKLLRVPTGFGKDMAWVSDEIRAWHLAGDTSLGTIQGALGVMSDPINAAKTARKLMGKRPTAELARVAADEADDVAEYTFATNRSFGSSVDEIRQARRGVERIPGVKKASDELYALYSLGSYEAWKHERDIIMTQNEGIDRALAGHEAANMLSKVVPGLDPAERGVSGSRGALERGVATSISFASAPALLGAEAAKGTAQLVRQGFYTLARSAEANPAGAWAALTPREQVAIRRAIVGSSVVMTLAAGSAILAADSRNMSVDDAVKETFDTKSRYFMALQLGGGKSIPLGGPFRSAIKAVVPGRDGVLMGNLPGYVGTRINSPAKPAIDIVRNKDFYGDPIYSGNIARPENALKALWYAADQGLAPVSIGEASQDIRKGEFSLGKTGPGVISQFLGTNMNPVSPTEKLNQIARAGYGKNFYDLLPKDQSTIKKGNPKLWDEAVRQGSDARRSAEAKKKEINTQQTGDDDLLLKGKLSVQKWTEATDDRGNQVVGANDVLYKDSKNGSKPVSPVLEEYYQRIQASSAENNGRVDWDEVGAWRDALPKSAQKVIDQNTGLNKTPLARLRSDLTQEYYALPRYRGYTADQAADIDELWQEVRNSARGTSDAVMLGQLSRMNTKGYDDAVITGVKRRILGLLKETNDRSSWTSAHPESAVFLRRGNLTREDADAITKALRAYR